MVGARHVVAGLVGGLLALATVGPAATHHRVYWAEAPSNYTFAVKQWTIDGTFLRWCSDDNAFYASNAIQRWEEMLPGTQWAENCESPNVWIRSYLSGGHCDYPSVGCVYFQWYWWWEADRDGFYLAGADVWLNDQDWDFTDGGRVATANHEVGHIYGLHERYDDLTGLFVCNPDDVSVMEGMLYYNGTNFIYRGCDTDIPANNDVSRVQAFYDLAGPGNPGQVQPGPTSVIWYWTDVNWAESYYAVHYYYWSGTDWDFVRSDYHSLGVAPGRPTDPRTLFRTFQVPLGWPAGTYISCVETHNEVYGSKYWVCTPSVYLHCGVPPGNLPDGALVRGESQSKVYVVYRGAKFWIHTPQDFDAMGFSWNNVQCVPDSFVNSISDVPPDGTLVREFNTAPVYLMACEARFWVPDQPTLDMLVSNGYASAPVYVVPPGEATRLGTAPEEWCNLKEASRPEQYVVCQGYKWHIFSMFALARIGLGNSPPRVLWDGALSAYPTSADLSHCQDTDGDGYSDLAERYVGTGATDPCGNDGWPADLAGGASENKVDVTDVLSFVAPVNRLGSGPGDANYSARWDLVPSPKIDITDVLNLVVVTPPMFGGASAFLGPTCPYPP